MVLNAAAGMVLAPVRELQSMSIPKNMHLIWVGDQSLRPDAWIQTWRDHHPGWDFRLWGNDDYRSLPWSCKQQMDLFAARGEWCGVADIMRYQILNEHGGFYADADSVCVRPLDDSLLQNEMFVCNESEEHAPGIIANGFIGAIPGHPVFSDMLENISHLGDMYRWGFYRWRLQKRSVAPWRAVGTLPFTKIVMRHRARVKILPSVSFIPQWSKDQEERVIYARHLWGTTNGNYDPGQKTLTPETFS